jgi:hypothetical protein
MTLVIAPGVSGNNAQPIQGDTLLVYLVDRSGSMNSCWEPTIGGLNSDLAVQKQADDGKTEVAMIFFDSPTHGQTRLIKPYVGPLSEAIDLSLDKTSGYAPHGGTPLYDAVGRMIQDIRARVEATDTNPKPNVLVSIYTDGGNTDHHGYSPTEVTRMVEECQGSGWTFTYFGANQDAWKVGGSFGIAAGNTMSYDTSNMRGMMASASIARSAHTQMAKAAYASGATYESVNFFEQAGQTEEDYKKSE